MNQFAIKSLGEGQYGAFIALFGSAKSVDLDGEYFDETTDFWLGKWDKVPAIFEHGQDAATKSIPVVGEWQNLAVAEKEFDGVAYKGVWADLHLDKAHKYHDEIETLLAAGALKTSSDSILHLVQKEKQSNGAVKNVVWPVAGASMTTAPCEYRMVSVPVAKSAFKSIGVEVGAELDEPVSAFKSQYLGDYTETDITSSVIYALCDRLMWNVVYDVFYDVAEGESTPQEARAVLAGALAEFQEMTLKVYDAIVGGNDGEGADAAAKSLAAIKDKTNTVDALLDGAKMVKVHEVALAATKAYVERSTGIAAKKAEDGRAFPSATKRVQMEEAATQFEGAAKAIRDLIPPDVDAAIKTAPVELAQETGMVVPDPALLRRLRDR